MVKVPFVDLKKQMEPIKTQIHQAIDGVLNRCDFVLGESVAKFEKEFAQFCGAKFCVGVANGTDAIHLALRALGVGPGDEVIVPAHTFIASALGVAYTGAKPVFVDIRPHDFLLDVNQIEKSLTSKTKAILPVHLYGRMANMEPILSLAKKNKLFIVEDTAQAHGAEINGKRAGTLGDIGCFSFYPGKNLGAYGDGGAVVTNNEDLKNKIEALRNYGSPKKYNHPVLGFNCRLDTIQAAILSVKLPHLDNYNLARRNAAKKYNEALKGIGDLILPEIPNDASHIFHLYVIRTKKRDALLEHLNNQGIGAGIHYPTPMHLHGAFKELGYKSGQFSVSETICKEIVSLPMFPEITDDQIQRVASNIKGFF